MSSGGNAYWWGCADGVSHLLTGVQRNLQPIDSKRGSGSPSCNAENWALLPRAEQDEPGKSTRSIGRHLLLTLLEHPPESASASSVPVSWITIESLTVVLLSKSQQISSQLVSTVLKVGAPPALPLSCIGFRHLVQREGTSAWPSLCLCFDGFLVDRGGTAVDSREFRQLCGSTAGPI